MIEPDKKTFVGFAQSARRHPVVASVVVLIGAVLLVGETRDGRALQVIAYLGAMILSAVIVDFTVAFLEKPRAEFPVREPRREIIVAAVLYPLALAVLAYRFSHSFPLPAVSSRLLFVAAMILFGLHLALALYLLARGYSLKDLGIRVWGFAPVPLIMLVCMGLVALTTPLRNTWTEVYRGLGGVWGWIALCFTAPLPEEFFRVVWQTRAGKWLSNPAAGWLIASLLWAGMHWFILSPGHSHLQTLFWVLYIVPYGLMLGYLTHRTKSILPAILLHATKFVWLGRLG